VSPRRNFRLWASTSAPTGELGRTSSQWGIPSLGRHLLDTVKINPVAPGAEFLNLNRQNKNPQNTSPLSTNFLVLYTGYGTVDLREFAANSTYHGLLLQMQHRLAHGISLGANYTFSKALDTADAYSSGVDPFLRTRSRDCGPAGFNKASVFTGTFYYRLSMPGKSTGVRPLGWVADNWELSGVTRMITGDFTPGYSLITGLTTPTSTATEGARMEVTIPRFRFPIARLRRLPADLVLRPSRRVRRALPTRRDYLPARLRSSGTWA
jgi:hypothetical protein